MSWKTLSNWKALTIACIATFGVACSSSQKVQDDRGPMAQNGQMQQDDVAEREAIIGQADAWQPGIVRDMSDETLILEPYQRAAGEARIQIDPETPVFQEEGRVSTRALQPGTDVRVFYRHDATGAPQVVAVEILSPEEANEVRGLFEGQQNQQQQMEDEIDEFEEETEEEMNPGQGW